MVPTNRLTGTQCNYWVDRLKSDKWIITLKLLPNRIENLIFWIQLDKNWVV